MKCLVFSDSHGSDAVMSRALSQHPDAEVVFFLGDGLSEAERLLLKYPTVAFISVRGNCDGSVGIFDGSVERVASVTLNGRKIVLTHGDLYGAKQGNGGLLSLAYSRGAEILLFGHTHRPMHELISDGSRSVHLFNPGSASPSSGSYGIMILDREVIFSHGSLICYCN